MAIKGSLDDIFNDDPYGLLDIKPAGSQARNADERLVASFEEINSFYEKNNREPSSGNGVQEHQLKARLNRIRADLQKVDMLKPYDRFKLLEIIQKPIESINDIWDDDDFGLLETSAESI